MNARKKVIYTCLVSFIFGSVCTFVLKSHIRRIVYTILNVEDNNSISKRPSLWQSRSGQFEVLDQLTKKPNIIYLGDSTTDWVNLEEYLEYTPGTILNRAIAGDTTQGILQRIKHSFPSKVRICFLLAGYNDLHMGRAPEKVATNILAIRDFLLDHNLVQHVVVESVLHSDNQLTPSIRQVNTILLSSQRPNSSYLDLNATMAINNKVFSKFYVDPVHLNADGILQRLRVEKTHLLQYGLINDTDLSVLPDEE